MARRHIFERESCEGNLVLFDASAAKRRETMGPPKDRPRPWLCRVEDQAVLILTYCRVGDQQFRRRQLQVGKIT